MADTTTCEERGCDKPARLAIRTTRPTRANLKSTIYYDERVAPKTASRYCNEHGTHLAAELVRTLADGDD